jgi:hypothetical protein
VTDMADLIRADHARVSKVIEQLDGALAGPQPAAGRPETGLMWETLAGFLQLHVAAAEEIAYLALAGAAPDAVAGLA